VPAGRGVASWTKSISDKGIACGTSSASRCCHNRNTCYAWLKDYCKGGIFMHKIMNQFADSAKELKKLKTIVITGLLIAIGIILGQFSIQISQSTKVGISFIATQLTAMLFGPVIGGIMGGVSDVLKFIIKPTGNFLIGYTINAMVGPIIYGILLYKRHISFWRILISKAVVAVLVNLLLGCYWQYLYFGAAIVAILPGKILQQLIQVPVQSILFYIVVVALKKAKVFQLVQ